VFAHKPVSYRGKCLEAQTLAGHQNEVEIGRRRLADDPNTGSADILCLRVFGTEGLHSVIEVFETDRFHTFYAIGPAPIAAAPSLDAKNGPGFLEITWRRVLTDKFKSDRPHSMPGRLHSANERVNTVCRFAEAVASKLWRQRQSHVQNHAVLYLSPEAHLDSGAAHVDRFRHLIPFTVLLIMPRDARGDRELHPGATASIVARGSTCRLRIRACLTADAISADHCGSRASITVRRHLICRKPHARQYNFLPRRLILRLRLACDKSQCGIVFSALSETGQRREGLATAVKRAVDLRDHLAGNIPADCILHEQNVHQ